MQSPAPDRDARLNEMLDRIRSDGLSYRSFSQPEELGALIADDLALLLSERFDVVVDQRADSSETRQQLPTHATRFIGRGHELSSARRLLTDGTARIVTLVGPGGIGKTRLALEVGALVVPDFERVVMVALEEVSSADLVMSSIASALGVPESPGRSLLDSVTEFLRGRQMLLLIDNFEQVVAAASVLGHLIAGTSGVVLLVTSRKRLRLTGEQVIDVPPLLLPNAVDDPAATRLSDSVELLIDRVRAGGSDLEPDDCQLQVIAEICRRLDGIPLAIELAAPRLRILGPDELLRRLDQRLSILTGGPRDLPTRHETLRSTIAWSHDLLGDSDRRLFSRLGVFAAGFSLEAAEAVCADDAVPDVLDGIASLVDESLLRIEDTLHGQPRFTMLQAIREFALEALDGVGETERMRRAHADFYQGGVIAAEQRMRTDSGPVVAQFLADQANIRAATRWSLDVREGGRVARLAAAMWPYSWIAGVLSEALDAIEQALSDEGSLSAGDRAHAWLGLGMLAFAKGDYERAAPALGNAVDLYRELGDARSVATASVPLGVINAVRHQDRGEDMLTGAADTFRALDDPWGLAFSLLNLGGVLLLHHNYTEAIPVLEESVELARAIHADAFISNALINLGWVHLRLGDLESARQRLSESMKHAAAVDHREILARALDAMAAVDDTAGNPELGATLFGAADAIRRSIGAGGLR